MRGDCWSDGIRSYAPIFFLTVWFQTERGEALLVISIMGLILQSMLMSEAKNDMEAKFPRTSNGGFTLCGDVELAW
jgi:hypothetical protein